MTTVRFSDKVNPMVALARGDASKAIEGQEDLSLPPLPKLAKASTLSKVEPHEEQFARDLIDQQFIEMTGAPMDLTPAGFFVALRLWIPPEAKELEGGKKLFFADTHRDERKFTSAVALVCALGPDAYKGERFERTGPWCKVGDWVMFNRYEGNALSYLGVPMVMLPDDRVLAIVSDPAEVESINSASKL